MKLSATVDSVVEGKASLLLRDCNGGEERPLGVFPLESLPEGVKAGDILTVCFEIDEFESKKARERVAALRERLLKNNQK